MRENLGTFFYLMFLYLFIWRRVNGFEFGGLLDAERAICGTSALVSLGVILVVLVVAIAGYLH